LDKELNEIAIKKLDIFVKAINIPFVLNKDSYRLILKNLIFTIDYTLQRVMKVSLIIKIRKTNQI
jgi:hypothetical protein